MIIPTHLELYPYITILIDESIYPQTYRYTYIPVPLWYTYIPTLRDGRCHSNEHRLTPTVTLSVHP